jgi:hypothetical protein
VTTWNIFLWYGFGQIVTDSTDSAQHHASGGQYNLIDVFDDSITTIVAVDASVAVAYECE